MLLYLTYQRKSWYTFISRQILLKKNLCCKLNTKNWRKRYYILFIDYSVNLINCCSRKSFTSTKSAQTWTGKTSITKRPAEARDAREVAKKLIKSGAISAISKQQKQPEQGFKRPRGNTQISKFNLILIPLLTLCRSWKKTNIW